AYNPALAYQHAVLLDGLLPDQEYVFSVTSRDRAGNSTTDDNKKKLYRFRTLKPLIPPWTDNFEQGRSGWVVSDDTTAVDEETGESLLDSRWEYGIPQNQYGIRAHSGLYCWATNLKGQPVSLAISDLISPAIDLTRYNRATLKFWQYYDFTERSEYLDIELGQLAISTNNGASWKSLYSIMSDVSPGWEEVRVDVSKYTGYVVRFMWDYQMFSFEPYPRPGWLIDDVSLIVDTAPTGTLLITNNIAQASFTVAGPITLTTNGLQLRITNAPIGQYSVAWNPVQFFITPPPQTNTLTAGTQISFAGHYTFPDANRNGISDLFEQRYFNNVDQNRLPGWDTDRDGLTDYDEFVAGTDPTTPASVLRMVAAEIQPNRTVRVKWTTAQGHLYRLLLSTNLVHWVPATDWIRSSSSDHAVTLPPLSGSDAYYFKVECLP
ncbi:MAG: choice-of-anchor J domain-containing protein, partial [Verrucomicrobiae bacterium]|nr:choice-of-anchor J domain-containing protein [Verrucomicrobiae bacterium]